MLDLSYRPDTYLHAIPAGVKLLLLSAATLFLFQVNDVFVLCGAFIFILVIYAVAGMGFLKKGISALRSLWIFIVFLAVWHIWTDSMTHGVMIALRLICAFLLAQLVTMTSQLSAILAVFERMLWPLEKLGVNTRPVTISCALMIRFVPRFFEHSVQLRHSWQLRSAKSPRTNLLVPLAGSALKEADEVAQALRARGAMHKQQH